MSSAYEECKADCVALFLSIYPEVVSTLLPCLDEQQIRSTTEMVWVEMALSGVKALSSYDQLTSQWL